MTTAVLDPSHRFTMHSAQGGTIPLRGVARGQETEVVNPSSCRRFMALLHGIFQDGTSCKVDPTRLRHVFSE